MGNAQETHDLDELADRLVERRERLSYYMIGAAAGVLVFVLNSLNSPTAVLTISPRGLIVLSCALLISAAATSLYLIWERQNNYWHYLDIRYNQAGTATDNDRTGIVARRRRMGIATLLFGLLFGVAMGFLVTAYISALGKVT